ncbi:MAG: translesion error-prone DNA polymerase V autoproteolytic subunit [Ginsengibacter sp.]
MTQKITIPYIQSAVKCGFPSPALDYMEERIDLNKVLIQHPLSTFIIASEGYSMTDAFIPPKAKLIVDRSLQAKNGDIILAVLNGEFTIKYLKQNNLRCWLVPANKKFKEVEINSEMDFQIWGVITSIIINPNDTKCML